jgi:hypothetical protein
MVMAHLSEMGMIVVDAPCGAAMDSRRKLRLSIVEDEVLMAFSAHEDFKRLLR